MDQPVAKLHPHRSANSLRDIYRAHCSNSAALSQEFRRLWSRELTESELNLISSFVLCCTHHHAAMVAASFAVASASNQADAEFGNFASLVGDSAGDLISEVERSYRPWGIELDVSKFPNLLAWEAALVAQLP